MKKSFKRRPQDFKRKILKKLYTSRSDLLEAEFRYLKMMKPEELGIKYYNIRNHHFKHWTTHKDKLKTIGEKISRANKGRMGSWSIGVKKSEETKQKIRDANKRQFEDITQRELRSVQMKALWADPEYRQKQVANKIGRPQSAEHIENRMKKIRLLPNPGFKKGNIPHNKKPPHI